MRDRGMAQDFREAMLHLCRRRIDHGTDEGSATIVEWLRGDLRLLGALKPVPIGAKITRHNGRAMLRSLCHWLGLCGVPGIIVYLDIRWSGQRDASTGGIKYTPAAVLDLFEVLRQFIDDAERLEGLFMVVAGGHALTEGEDTRRTLDRYPALRNRVSDDVRATRHDNPLAPLVRVVLGTEGPKPISAGASPYSPERVAIEALRAGVPNDSAIRLLRREEDEWTRKFAETLRAMYRTVDRSARVQGEIIEGGFGTGKSHLLGLLARIAQDQHFIVSQVSISKETPLFSLDRVYAAAMRNAVAPDINDDVMSVAIGMLDFASSEFRGLEEWTSSPESGLSPWFAALLHVLSRNVLGPEDKLAIARFLSGSRLSVAKVKGWLRGIGARGLFDIRPVKAGDFAHQRLRFAPALFRAAGFSGWCVLLDEVELVGRYSGLQRGKSYAELARWLGLEPMTAVPGIISVAAIVDDFRSEVLHGRLDEEKVPRLLEAKGLLDVKALAEIGMRALDGRHHQLATPHQEELARDLEVVKGLYQSSYHWRPDAAEIGEMTAAATMRGYVKSWITSWDIKRVYGVADEIVAKTIQQDLTENKDFETPPDEPAEEDA